MVYILSKNGTPIMPTNNHAKVRLLLKYGKAKIVKRTPFIIQLLSSSKTYKQDVTLGIDAGSKHVGMSATTTKKELFVAEIRPRNDVVELLSTRRELRSSRRSRKTRYRKARFNNRVKTKHKGWLAPSIEVKIWNHIQGIKLVNRVLPLTKIVVETAEFDLQKLKAVEEGKVLPAGKDYQLGEQYGYYNVRQYVLHRDRYKCVCCGANKNVKLHVHHLESRKVGGNAPDNLLTLCESCHKAYHAGRLNLPLRKRKLKPTRDAIFMGIMRRTLMTRLVKLFPHIGISETRGYITKYWRERSGVIKSHINDAFVISNNLGAKRINKSFLIVPKRQHNRQIHKCTINKGGKRKLNQLPKYVFGYQLFDKVLCLGQVGFIFARRTRGSFKIRNLDGNIISRDITYKKLKLLERRKSILVDYIK
ncbi:MAG: RNA-guided endonuclease IscB [Romboutsia timonensis]